MSYAIPAAASVSCELMSREEFEAAIRAVGAER